MAESGGELVIGQSTQGSEERANGTKVDNSPSTGPVTSSAQAAQVEQVSGQLAEKAGSQPQAVKPGQRPASGSQEVLQSQQPSFKEALQKEFDLTEEQVNQLLVNGDFNEETLSNPEKIIALIQRLKTINGLTTKQLEKITQFESDFMQVQSPEEQQQSKEQLKKRIQAKREEIRGSALSNEEKERALAQLDQIEKALDQSPTEEQQEGMTEEQKQALQKTREDRVKAKVEEYVKYAGIGIAALFIILMLQGAKGQGGGN